VTIAPLTRLLREKLLILDGVKRHGPVRRASVVYSADSPSDCLYFVESGYIKIVQKGVEGKEVLLGIIAPGEVFGEQSVAFPGPRNASAEVLQDGVLFEIPRQVFLDFCQSNPECWQSFAEMLLGRVREAERKVGMLCLNDVEARILHYLGSLTSAFGVTVAGGQEYSLPLSQSELASLIGATRETTSTTLNNLARRGLLKLGRRLVTVTSPEVLHEATQQRLARAAQV